MATGEVKWFEGGRGLGYVVAGPARGVKWGQSKELPFGDLDVEFVTINLGDAEFGETIQIKGSTIVSAQKDEISGEWRSFISEPGKDGFPRRPVEPQHIAEAFDFAAVGVELDALGVRDPISTFGIHVLPLHLGRGLFATIYVNVAKSQFAAEQQRIDFFEKGAEVSFQVETRFPYLQPEQEANKEVDHPQDSPEFWLQANLISLSREATSRADSMIETAKYVSEVCKRIS